MPASSTGSEPKPRSEAAARRRLLLILLVAEVQRALEKLSPLIHWAFGLALAMAASQLIESLRFFDSFEDLIVREVARQRELEASFELPQPHELQVQQIEVSAQARVASLEQREGVGQVVERLGGVAPIRRGAMAEVITELAKRLPAPSPDRPRIVAIDVDLAPLEGGATTGEERQQMLQALTRLREKAHVLVIVLPRPASPAQLREDRNAFMRDAQCTRLGAGAAPPPGGTLHALFFASPRLFQQAGSYPTKYPHRLGADAGDTEAARQVLGAGELPPYYPALGNLIHLQFTHRLPHVPEVAANVPQAQADERLAARLAMTTLCEQAYAPGPGGTLLEDHMDTPAAATIAKAYREQRFSWRLLDDPRLQHTTIDGADSLRRPDEVHDALFERPVLLLGIDGGASYDKFGIAGIVDQEVSGASLHALQALSISKPVSPLWEKVIGILLDALLGIAYALAWFLIYHKLGLKALRTRMPVLGGWLVAGVPLALGVFLTWLCFKVVAIGMGVDLWINPIYIVAGLLLGIYVDAWNDSEPGGEDEQRVRHRMLGLPAAREALRSGFGQRIEPAQFAPSSGYSTITGLDELRAHAAVVRKRLGPMALADAVLSAVLRVIVLCWGWALIAYELFKVGSS